MFKVKINTTLVVFPSPFYLLCFCFWLLYLWIKGCQYVSIYNCRRLILSVLLIVWNFWGRETNIFSEQKYGRITMFQTYILEAFNIASISAGIKLNSLQYFLANQNVDLWMIEETGPTEIKISNYNYTNYLYNYNTLRFEMKWNECFTEWNEMYCTSFETRSAYYSH